MKNFTFNADAAARQDAPRSIVKSGAYIGKIIQAEMYESKQGAQMLELGFVTAESHARLGMCLVKADGEETFQVGLLQSLMGLVGAQNATHVAGKVRDRDGSIRDGFRVPTLENKTVGIVLQREDDLYQTANGEYKEYFAMRIVAFYDAVTMQTYHEKAGGKEAKKTQERIDKLIPNKISERLQSYLADKNAKEDHASNVGQSSLDNFDDVPF